MVLTLLFLVSGHIAFVFVHIAFVFTNIAFAFAHIAFAFAHIDFAYANIAIGLRNQYQCYQCFDILTLLIGSNKQKQ